MLDVIESGEEGLARVEDLFALRRPPRECPFRASS